MLVQPGQDGAKVTLVGYVEQLALDRRLLRPLGRRPGRTFGSQLVATVDTSFSISSPGGGRDDHPITTFWILISVPGGRRPVARLGDLAMTAPSTEDALRYVLANVDDARAALETANNALATATAYGRIAVARDHGNDTDDGGTQAT